MSEKTLPESKKLKKTAPKVCKAVRTVGVIKPEFDLRSQNFTPPKLKVFGTGFWLKDSKIFVTCAHVVQPLLGTPIEIGGILVVGGNSSPYMKAFINTIDFVHDLAVLNLGNDINFIDEQSKTGLELVTKNYEIGTEIAYSGFPLGNQLLNQNHSPSYAEGVIGSEIIENEGRKQIQISGPIVGGYSGSPIVLKENTEKVLGVISNSPSKEAGDANIFMGVHWKHIKSLTELAKS